MTNDTKNSLGPNDPLVYWRPKGRKLSPDHRRQVPSAIMSLGPGGGKAKVVARSSVGQRARVVGRVTGKRMEDGSRGSDPGCGRNQVIIRRLAWIIVLELTLQPFLPSTAITAFHTPLPHSNTSRASPPSYYPPPSPWSIMLTHSITTSSHLLTHQCSLTWTHSTLHQFGVSSLLPQLSVWDQSWTLCHWSAMLFVAAAHKSR